MRKTNQIIIEKSKDAILQQLKAKLLHEEYSENLLHQDARYRHYANNLERIVLKDEILTRQYFDETGNVKYHQILLPQHLLQELLQSLHGTAHKHPGISKMLQETRQRYYFPNMAKHVKKWVEGCEECARDKRVPNATITPELLNLPEWDLGPEDAMQIDLLPNLPPSGGCENVLTAIDVFSRYQFAYPLTDASAINVAKGIIDIMTKHAYLPTTLITDKGTAFTSTIIAEVTQTLGITLKCATTKHPQTIGKADHQGSKIPFRDYRWVGPFVIQKVLPNGNYIVRRINTNKTQILHRIRLKKFVPNQPLEDNFREQQLHPDEEIVFPQDDLYIITCETDIGEQLITRGHNPIPTSMPNGERPNAAEPSHSDVDENEADYIITREELNNDNATHSQNDRLSDDVTKRNEANAVTGNEEFDWPNPAVSPKNKEKSLPNMADRPENDEFFSERNLMNEDDAQNSHKRGDDIIVPEISQDDTRNESLSPRAGKYNLRPNPNPNYSEDFRF